MSLQLVELWSILGVIRVHTDDIIKISLKSEGGVYVIRTRTYSCGSLSLV